MHSLLQQKYDLLVAGGMKLKVTRFYGETSDGKGHYAHFDMLGGYRASLFSYQNGGTFAVHGAIQRKYEELSFELGFLGYPVSDEEKLFNRAGYYLGQIGRFQGGSIVWLASDRSLTVTRADGTPVPKHSGGHAAEAARELQIPTRSEIQMEAMAETVALLGEVIGIQQKQLVDLAEEINAVSLLNVQMQLNREVQNSRDATLKSLKGALSSANRSGEIVVGGSTHTGHLKIVRKTEENSQRSGKLRQLEEETNLVQAKLKSALAKLFIPAMAVKVDTRRAVEFLEEASEKSHRLRAEEAEGTFEIRHEASTIRLNRD